MVLMIASPTAMADGAAPPRAGESKAVAAVSTPVAALIGLGAASLEPPAVTVTTRPFALATLAPAAFADWERLER